MTQQARLAAQALANLAALPAHVVAAAEEKAARQKPAAEPGAARLKAPQKFNRLPPSVPPWLYSRTSALVARDPRLNGTDRALIATLATWCHGVAGKEVDAWIDQLADIMGVSGRTVQRSQAKLAGPSFGYLTVTRRRAAVSSGGRGSLNDSNVYTLTALALPPQRTPQRRGSAGGDKNVTPPTGPTVPEVSLSDRSSSRLRPRLVGAIPTPALRATPSRPMREWDCSADGEAQKPCHPSPARARAPP